MHGQNARRPLLAIFARGPMFFLLSTCPEFEALQTETWSLLTKFSVSKVIDQEAMHGQGCRAWTKC